MIDRRTQVMSWLEGLAQDNWPMFHSDSEVQEIAKDALALIEEQGSLLGMQQTANGITFLSTGTAQQGEERGLLLGKAFMHERLEKELLHRGLLTDEIRTVFDEAKNL